MRYENIRKITIENRSEKVNIHCSAQVMDKITKINHYEIGEIVKKYTHRMISELVGKYFGAQFKEKASYIVDDGIDLTMEKLRMAYAIKGSIRHNVERLRILAGLDFDELGPVHNGMVVRENWLRFMNLTMDSCMPGSKKDDYVDPLTGRSREEQDVLDEAAREDYEQACEEDARNWGSEDDSDLVPDFFDEDSKEDNDIPF